MIGPESKVVPDAIEPIEAWRVWKLDDYLGEWSSSFDSDVRRRITLGNTAGSVSSKQPWISQGTTTAICGAGKDHGSVMAPDEECSCGLYAANKTPVGLDLLMKNWFDQLKRCTAIMGEVRLWGKVIPGEKGYRAQYGRVVGFYRTWPDTMENPKWLRPLIDRFQVPLLELPRGSHDSVGRLIYDSSGLVGRDLDGNKRVVSTGRRHGKSTLSDLFREHVHTSRDSGRYSYHGSGQSIDTCSCANCRLTEWSPGIKDLNGDCLLTPRTVSMAGMRQAPEPKTDPWVELQKMMRDGEIKKKQTKYLWDLLNRMEDL